jgi:hypothetical protein
VSIACRRCTPAELKMGQVERRIVHTTWAFRQFRRYTAFAPKVKVVLPDPELTLVVTHTDHHQRLAALLIELSMYNVEWVQGSDDWNIADAFLQPEALVDAVTDKGERLTVPQWKHPGDYEVVLPVDQSGDLSDVRAEGLCVASFEGGAAQKLGAGGYCF